MGVVPACEEFDDRHVLGMAYLQRDKSFGEEGGVGLGDEAAVEVEAVGACEEGGGGLVVADLGVEGGAVGVWDVGGVADDGVEGGGGGQVV